RLLVWLLILGALIGGGYGGVKAWANRSYYVGLDGDHVAIYRGLPISFAGVHLSHVQEQTQIKEADVAEYFRPRLVDGIRFPSLVKARDFLATIPPTPAALQRLHPPARAGPRERAARLDRDRHGRLHRDAGDRPGPPAARAVPLFVLAVGHSAAAAAAHADREHPGPRREAVGQARSARVPAGRARESGARDLPRRVPRLEA